MSCKNPKECDEGCPGWAWFNESEIERCDTCARFSDDVEAAEHVVSCLECALALGREIASGEVTRMKNESPMSEPASAGYTHCACRDCFDETVSSDETKPELCSLCEEAGCDADGKSECCVECEGTWGFTVEFDGESEET